MLDLPLNELMNAAAGTVDLNAMRSEIVKMCRKANATFETLSYHLQSVVGAESDLHISGIGSYMTERGLIDVTMRRQDVAHFQEVCAAARREYPDMSEWTFHLY